MADSSYEFTGKTVDECVDEGLAQLGLKREQVEIEVLHKGSRGIFGLGSEPCGRSISLLYPRQRWQSFVRNRLQANPLPPQSLCLLLLLPFPVAAQMTQRARTSVSLVTSQA
jgi:hypothetical protein